MPPGHPASLLVCWRVRVPVPPIDQHKAGQQHGRPGANKRGAHAASRPSLRPTDWGELGRLQKKQMPRAVARWQRHHDSDYASVPASSARRHGGCGDAGAPGAARPRGPACAASGWREGTKASAPKTGRASGRPSLSDLTGVTNLKKQVSSQPPKLRLTTSFRPRPRPDPSGPADPALHKRPVGRICMDE